MVLQGLHLQNLPEDHLVPSGTALEAQVHGVGAVVHVQGQSLVPLVVADAEGEEGLRMGYFEGEVGQVEGVILTEGLAEQLVDGGHLSWGNGVRRGVLVHAVDTAALGVLDGV